MILGLGQLLRFTKHGIYCEKGDFWIDPSKKVDKAIITHAHSDHARRGHGEYFCSEETAALLRLFFGNKIDVKELEYSDSIEINGVKVTLFSAGHILGASQVLLEYNGLRVVIAGDYKIEDDNVSKPFESVNCDVFVTESTFAKPKYDWKPQNEVFKDINSWWLNNQKEGKLSILNAYSLGKSQRLLKNIDSTLGRIFIPEKTAEINEIYNTFGAGLPQTNLFHEELKIDDLQIEDLLIIPQSALKFDVLNNFENKSTAFVSGWVADKWFFKGDGFAISDHADWKGLLQAIKQTGAERVYVQHGFTTYFTKYLKSTGVDAYDIKTCLKYENNVELF
jgi:putative mRNA 3-end processing factor